MERYERERDEGITVRLRPALEAAEDERLCERVVAHLTRDNRSAHVDRELVPGMVADCTYKIEHIVIYPNGSGPDEEFGLEPC